MKHTLTHHWLHLLPAAFLTFTTGCSGPKDETTPKVVTTVTVVQPGVAGGLKVNTHRETATVTAVDKAARKVTLLKEDGTKSVITCGPEVVNFAQIEKGDRIVATLTERLVVFVRPPGEASAGASAGAVVLAPVGEKPDAMVASLEEVTAKIVALDLVGRKATLLFPNGTSQTIGVRPDVDMTMSKVGDDVTFRVTEAVAIRVEKP